MIKKLLLLFIPITFFVSCDKTENKENVTVLSGQIVNPKVKYVLLEHTGEISDTIYLDDRGFFTHSFTQKKEGLFRIRHGELQYIYLNPGDSIVFRVNTLEFDESLAFSGKGAEKNNFLIDQFLKNETFNTNLPEEYKLAPAEFEKLIKNHQAVNNKNLNRFYKESKSSDGFWTIAKANIDYNYYSQKELYTTNHNFNYDEAEQNYPKDFYDYRTKINCDATAFKNYYAYFSFLNRYFDNVAFDIYKKEASFDRNSFVHNKTKLKLIDSIIKNEELKNQILSSTVRRYLINADEIEDETKMIELFNKLDLKIEDQKNIKEYAEKTSRINAGNKAPNLMLVNVENETIFLSDITNQLTVLYFWSSNNIKHVKLIHSRITELKSKFPEYNFIGINTDNNFKTWKKIVTNSGYNHANEFQFDNAQKATSDLLINNLNKAIILDKKGVILEGNSYIFNQNFESKLLGLINK